MKLKWQAITFHCSPSLFLPMFFAETAHVITWVFCRWWLYLTNSLFAFRFISTLANFFLLVGVFYCTVCWCCLTCRCLWRTIIGIVWMLRVLRLNKKTLSINMRNVNEQSTEHAIDRLNLDLNSVFIVSTNSRKRVENPADFMNTESAWLQSPSN